MEALERLQQSLAGRYAFEREIGRGGMATVYLARDVKHERHVAVKVLDPELGAVLGAERFLAEIRVTANLQHPNLLPLFDSGEADGLLFYVMPFVEGESLRARLTREKQLPLDDAVRITVAIANALDYAHGHGVIHRDLKPENILLQAGQPVIADFGIALAVSNAGGGRITQTGLSLGTPLYMSPEQATGDRGIDGRTDIYSLAAMAYEMLTGEAPHVGATSQAIIARLMTEEPRPMTTLRRNVPPAINAAVMRALEKLPADRYATAKEFAAALSAPGAMTAAALVATEHAEPASGAPATAPRASRLVPSMAVVTVAALAVAGWVLLRPARVERVTRIMMEIPDSIAPRPASQFAISRDGSMIAYVGRSALGGQLFIKARHQASATALQASSSQAIGNGALEFSPDGRRVAFVTGGTLRVAPVIGGPAVAIADTASPTRGLAWLDDESLVFVRDGGVRLHRVKASGGPVTNLWSSDSGTLSAVTALPESRGVLVSRCSGQLCARELDLWAVDLRSLKRTRVVANAMKGWYLPSGYLVFVRREGVLYAAPFDLTTFQLTGDPVPVLDSVSINGLPTLAISNEGTVVMRAGRTLTLAPTHSLVWVDRAGVESPVDPAWTFHLTVAGGNVGWSISPDGKRVAIGLNSESGDDIWVKQLPNGPLSRLSFDSAAEVRPRWSRDGRFVSYTSWNANVSTVGASSVQALVQRSADGTGHDSILVSRRPNGVFEHAFSPDGSYLVVRMGGTVNIVGGRDISVIRPKGDTTPRPLLASPAFDEAAFALSPDGKWIAFESNETGRVEVYIRPFPNVEGGKWQLSNGGGRAPLWNRNGRELFYVNAGREMMVAPITPVGAAPGIGDRKALFKLKDEWYLTERENYTPYDIAPDGKRFLMARSVQTGMTQLAPLIFIDNWFAELKQKLGKR